ncbi:MAG: radical SAM protein [Proteobacteria bacterium]|nr:radical SAM protein [Pseudomonadota bacterium]MCP4921066.1 radical SAM protein [Pseudomonadota bacterium]
MRTTRSFTRRSWTGELIVFSGNTDSYQPVERRYRLTRQCLEVCSEFGNPVGMITRSALVARDADVLADLDAHVTFSMPLWDTEMTRKLEPHAPSPQRRLEALATLAEAGVPVGINIAPCIPGLTEPQLPKILEASRAAGARWAFLMPLWLPDKTAQVFSRTLVEKMPLKARSVLERQVRRRGQLIEGPRDRARPALDAGWPAAKRLFEIHARRLGYADPPRQESTRFHRPGEQFGLFGG